MNLGRKPVLIIALLILTWATLACGIESTLARRVSPPAAIISSTAPPSGNTGSILPPGSTLPLLPTILTSTSAPTPFPQVQASPTRILFPSATPTTPTPTLTPRPTASAQQLDLLKEIWDTIQSDYLYRDFNGLDWKAVYQEYHQKIEAGLTDADFYRAMEEMITRLGDDHSAYLSPEQAKQEDQDFSGTYDYVGIGVLTSPIPERQLVSIILVFPDSPADQAGLKAHDSILTVNGEPILEKDSDRRINLRGPIGSSVTLGVQSPGEAPRQVKLVRRKINSELPVPHQVFTSPAGKRIGYIMLTTFNDETVPRKVRAALQDLHRLGRLDGLILDNRQNSGGANTVFEDVLSYFEDGKLGNFLNRQGKDPLVVDGRNIEESQKLPLVVLVGPNTASFGEIFSGILKDTKRAYLIGQLTDGNVEILYIYEFSDGSRIWLAHDTFKPINHPEQDWEKSGIIPDQEVIANWDEVTQENDPVIQASLNYFDKRRVK